MPTYIIPFTTTPSRANPATFSADMDARLSQENARIAEMNLQSGENNVINANVNAKEASAVAAASTATTKAAETLASANTASTAATTATTQAGIATTQAGLAGGYANAAIVTSFAGTLNYPIIRPSLNLDFANSKTIDPRITFTRASTATIYNEDGLLESVASGVPRITHNPVTGECEGLLIEESRTNLITYSNQFHNAAWGFANVSISPFSTISQSGLKNAHKLVEGPTTLSKVIANGTTLDLSIERVFSVYVKVAERSQIQLTYRNNIQTVSIQVIFDLVALTTTVNNYGAPISSITPTITNEGNGWYRCTIGGKLIASTTPEYGRVQMYLYNAGLPIYQGDGVSGLYIYGAQLEVGAFPTSYIPSTESFTSRASTAMYYNSAGLLASAPIDTVRMNYNPTNLKVAPSMLLEDSSTNLLTYSEDFSNATWSKLRATISSNTTATLDPYGTNLADKLVEDTSVLLNHQTFQAYTFAIAQYNYSIFLKAAERTFTYIKAFDGVEDHGIYVNLSLGSIGTSANILSSSITYARDGWYRVVFSFIPKTGAGNVAIFLATSDGNSVYTGDGVSGVYIFGAQLEVSPYAVARTSTIGTGSTTTAIVLDASASTTDDAYTGMRILISGEYRLISDYVGATKTATVSVAFTTAPVATTAYTIDYPTRTNETSYIPTTTAAVTRAADVYSSATSTRAADVAYMDGVNFSEWYRQDEGSFVVEAKGTSTSTINADVITVSDNTTSNSIKLRHTIGTTADATITTNNLSQVDTIGYAISNGVFHKNAISFKLNDFAENLNGGIAQTDTSCVIPVNKKINIGSNESGASLLNGSIKSLSYYPKRLTNTELQLLSTN